MLRGDDPVQIADVESAGGGKLRVKLTDGSIADIGELSFPSVGEQVLVEYSDNAEDARQRCIDPPRNVPLEDPTVL